MNGPLPTLFIDRDGTLIEEPNHVPRQDIELPRLLALRTFPAFFIQLLHGYFALFYPQLTSNIDARSRIGLTTQSIFGYFIVLCNIALGGNANRLWENENWRSAQFCTCC